MYFPVLLWSLVIFASFWGYGEALRRALKRPEFDDLGWGLTAAWGMAATLAIGGFLMMFSLAKAPMLTGVVLAGAALALYFVAQRLANTTNSHPTSKKSKSKQGKAGADGAPEPTQIRTLAYTAALASILVWGLMILAFASSIAWPFQVDPNDDLTGYLVYPHQILQSGTLIEPFSFQRAGTFGGQAFLQALVMVVGGERNGHVPDRGIAMIVLAGIFWGQLVRGHNWRRILGLLLLLAFLLIPVPRISTHGAMVGGCFIVASICTIARLPSGKISLSTLIPVGLLCAAATSIRPTFALLLALWFSGMIFVALFSTNRAEIIRRYLIISAIAALVISPFSALLYKSNGTPMIPPFNGFVDKQYQIHSYENFQEDLKAIVNFTASPAAMSLLLLAAVAFCFASNSADRVILVAAVGSMAFVLYKFSAQSYVDMFRFAYPLLVPSVFCILLKALNEIKVPSSGKSFFITPKTLSICTVISLLFIATAFGSQALNEIHAQFATLPIQAKAEQGFFDASVKKSYTELQSKVPPGESILTIVDGAYLMDFARNPVYSINVIGGSAPPPGIPFSQGPEALRSYFLKQGIRYMICVDFNNAVLLYTRRLWTTQTRPERFYQVTWKPRFTDFMNNIDDLDKKGYVVGRAGNVRLFDIQKNSSLTGSMAN
jgi:hypothetical protein